MVMVVLFEFSVMRCQPLRRALYKLFNTANIQHGKNSLQI
ncbi:acetyltransferase [Vibrio cholerae]|nr:acetyltransferase [Vibrio cholerae]